MRFALVSAPARHGRVAGAVLAAACALALLPSAANAATVAVNGSTLVYTGEGDENNVVVIKFRQGGYQVEDQGSEGVPVKSSPTTGCAGASSQAVCNASGVTSIRIDLGNGN